jgi:hypothetical protein
MVGATRRAVIGGAIVGLIALAAPSASASSGWTVQPTPNPDSKNNQLRAVSCTSAAACTAVGFAGGSKTLAERWNGTSWTAQTTRNPPGAYLSDLIAVPCVSATICTAVGSAAKGTVAERWNGTRWFVQPTPNPTAVPGAVQVRFLGVSCTSGSVCTAVGIAFGTADSSTALVERWAGNQWTVQSTPNTGASSAYLEGVSCTSATACMAVGYSGGLADSQALTERWNGSSWTILPTPNPPGVTQSALWGVSCTSSTTCTAVGDEDSGRTLAERWDGGQWTIQPTPNSAHGGTLSGVSCSSATACTAIGSGSGLMAQVWDGTTWTIQTPPHATGAFASTLNGVSCTSATACTAVGDWAPGGGDYDLFTLAEQES